MKNKMWFVSRQHYYYQDILVVEIAYPSIDYSSPDMLIPKYKGEGESYSNPIEALNVAISILEAWQADNPEEEIGITYGSFNGFEGKTYDNLEELKQLIQKEYDQLPKCAYCNELIDEKEYFVNDDSQFNEEKFCSEVHAEKAYSEGFDICYICEKEYQRRDMNYFHDNVYICPQCEKLGEDFSTIDIEKLPNGLFVGFSLEDQQITRYLLEKTYLTEKDFSNLKDMLEKLVIDINVIDEDMNTIEEINVG
jgi:hypothetical protein